MKQLAISLSLLATLAACQSGPSSGVTSVPGHGAISVQVIPNPIVAKQVSGSTYDFPFEVVVQETGGRPVNINRVSVEVSLPGGLNVGGDEWNAERIRSMGFSTSLGPRGELRYRFNPRKSVPDERLFGGISAELRVEATDDTGAATNARTVVTVTR